MFFNSKEIFLKNGHSAFLRSPESADASEMMIFLRTCFAETNFLMRYPEEWTQTDECEAKYIESTNASAGVMMIICTVDGQIVGNSTISFNQALKVRHRATISVGILSKYWGLGIGRIMCSEMISYAKEHGVLQIELDYIEGNERACNLYESMGFVYTGEIPNAVRLKDGTMLKAYSMVKAI